MIKTILIKFLNNRLFRYLFSRYFTYFIQFITSIFIAVKLGPYYFGIWGFMLLLINYFHIIDFGVSNALNILLVQYKESNRKSSDYVSNSYFLLGILSIIIIIIMLYYYVFGIAFFEKYKLGNYFYYICLIAIISNYNILFMNIYRVKNRLLFLSIYQSMIPILVLILVFWGTGETLLHFLIGAYVIGNVLSFIIFLFGKKLPPLGTISIPVSGEILIKGFFLFIYNSSFYLIIISIRSIISFNYSVEEFGFFSFALSLSNSILLFLKAMSFVIFPKIIDKLKVSDTDSVVRQIKQIRDSYVAFAFGLLFLALLFYPSFIYFIPKYRNAFLSLGLTSLAVILYINSFGYSSYLMAQNQEKKIAAISFFSLLVNISIAFVLIFIIKVSFDYVIIASIIAYIIFSFLCVYYGKKNMGLNEGLFSDFRDSFPLSLLVPYLIAILLVIYDFKYALSLPLLVFILLNRKSLADIVNKIKLIFDKPNVINI